MLLFFDNSYDNVSSTKGIGTSSQLPDLLHFPFCSLSLAFDEHRDSVFWMFFSFLKKESEIPQAHCRNQITCLCDRFFRGRERESEGSVLLEVAR